MEVLDVQKLRDVRDWGSPTGIPPDMEVLDVQKLRVVQAPGGEAAETGCEILVAGGGMGGVAAALAAARSGRRVVLTEETDWLGGQMTSQGVSALDEHRWIETFGGTRSYMELRRRVRDLYRERPSLRPEARQNPLLNPGNGWVSRLCFEPAVGVAALEAMLAPHVEAGRLRLLLRTRAVAVRVRDDAIESVLFVNLDTGALTQVYPRFVLDATELGDLLPLAGAEYVSGAEGQEETGEPHARVEGPDPECVQSFTYPFAVEFVPGGDFRGPAPPGYLENRERQPYTFDHVYYDERGVVTYRMFEKGEGAAGPFWTYRRLIDAGQFMPTPGHDEPRDIAMINWPSNDFRGGNLIDRPPSEAVAVLRQASLLSRGFLHWLQTEAPRDNGGRGYPELRPRPDVMGVPPDAPAPTKFPYIRESRRIVARFRVRQQEIAAAFQPGARAAFFPDSVGVGSYMIDLHPSERETKLPPQAARPFQIPLGALVPVRLRNLIAAAKNIGTTHIANGAYRLHPVEWNIGESAGLLASFCLSEGVLPAALCQESPLRAEASPSQPSLLCRFQRELVARGVPLYWFVDVPDGHPAFEAVQLLGAWGVWPGEPERLGFCPDEPLALEAACSLLARVGDRFVRDRPRLPEARLMPRAEWARWLLETISA